MSFVPYDVISLEVENLKHSSCLQLTYIMFLEEVYVVNASVMLEGFLTLQVLCHFYGAEVRDYRFN